MREVLSLGGVLLAGGILFVSGLFIEKRIADRRLHEKELEWKQKEEGWVELASGLRQESEGWRLSSRYYKQLWQNEADYRAADKGASP